MAIKKSIKITLWILLSIVFLIIGFFAVMWNREWRPSDIEYQSTSGLVADTITKDTLKIVTWNIGYAGLGDDMDFFYDGGKSVRCSKQKTQENLKNIISWLQQHRDADFILLQEVDFDSKRSYNMNEYDSIRTALPEFMGWWGLNYVSDFVPIPLTEPIGKVKSGLVLLSKYAPQEAIRLQYPSSFPFPVRLFNLKRCLLTASFHLAGKGNMLYINNTHNTAYDTGGMREKEMSFLRNYLQGKPYSVTAGDWNCNPPQYHASEKEMSDENFAPLSLNANDFSSDYTFAADTSTYSYRYGYEPYNKAITTRTILDFALLGKGMNVVSVKTQELDFRNSDHNPVIITVCIKND